MMPRLAVLAAIGLALPADLDVGVPPGSPLDYLRLPAGSPREKPVPTPGSGDQVGQTTAGGGLPGFFMPLSSPLTVDFGNHLNWKPRLPGGTSTGDPRFPYPPPYPEALYMHCVSFFLMMMLHGDLVSPREVVSYLIEIGEPAAYAASAVHGAGPVDDLARHVLDAAGGIQGGWPVGPFADRIDRDIAQELVSAFPYEDRFGKELLKLTGNIALPSLEKFAKGRHRFLARNAVFALRAYDEERVLPPLRAALKSADKVVRNRALAALLRWQDAEVVPWLVDQLDGADLAFRSYALHALGKIGDRRAVIPIVDQVRRQPYEWEFVWAAIPALARIRDGRAEVMDLLDRLAKDLPRRSYPAARRDILLERVRIARAYLGEKAEQALMNRGATQQANKGLVVEWLEVERRREELARRPAPAPPKPAPPLPRPVEPPAPSLPPAPDPAALALAEVREAVLQYTGVRSVEAEKGSLRVVVATEADAEDLRVLLGAELRGFWLVVIVAPS